MSFSDVLLMMFSAILVENFIFSRFYGCCPFLGVSEHPDTALGMGMAVTFVMTVSGAATWVVYHFLLEPLGLEYSCASASAFWAFPPSAWPVLPGPRSAPTCWPPCLPYFF